MKRIKKAIHRDAMNTFGGWSMKLSPEEQQRLAAHGGDLIKSGLIVDFFQATDSVPDPTFSDNVARMKRACADHLEGLGRRPAFGAVSNDGIGSICRPSAP